MSFSNAGNVWVWDRMGLYGRHGGRVRENRPHIREYEEWVAKIKGIAPAAPEAPKAAKPSKVEPPVRDLKAELPPPPPAFDASAIRTALSLVRGCKSADDLDAAAELFNADWPAGWPRSVELVWDAAFKNA